MNGINVMILLGKNMSVHYASSGCYYCCTSTKIRLLYNTSILVNLILLLYKKSFVQQIWNWKLAIRSAFETESKLQLAVASCALFCIICSAHFSLRIKISIILLVLLLRWGVPSSINSYSWNIPERILLLIS